MPTRIRLPNGSETEVEDHIALVLERDGRAEIIGGYIWESRKKPSGPPPPDPLTKDIENPPVDKAVHAAPVRKKA